MDVHNVNWRQNELEERDLTSVSELLWSYSKAFCRKMRVVLDS